MRAQQTAAYLWPCVIRAAHTARQAPHSFRAAPGRGLALGVSAQPSPRTGGHSSCSPLSVTGLSVAATDYSPRASCRGASSKGLVRVQAENLEPFLKN